MDSFLATVEIVVVSAVALPLLATAAFIITDAAADRRTSPRQRAAVARIERPTAASQSTLEAEPLRLAA